MTNFPITDKVTKEDLEWFAHLCMLIGVNGKWALDNRLIDLQDWWKMQDIMEKLVTYD